MSPLTLKMERANGREARFQGLRGLDGRQPRHEAEVAYDAGWHEMDAEIARGMWPDARPILAD